jgi:hypothetical protein
LEAPVIPELDLGGEELLNGLGRRQRAAVDPLEDRVERFEAAGHPQVREHVPQTIATRERGGFHAAPPVSWA